MKNPMNAPVRFECQVSPLAKTIIALSAFVVMVTPAPAAIAIVDATNISLAASQTESGGNTSDNPDVTGGLAGAFIPYTETGNFTLNQHLYGGFNLDDGDIGVGVASDGLYAIVRGNTLTLDFAPSFAVSSIAIYNGYSNRDNGTYTLTDGTNTLGVWNISTASSGTNQGVDSFWLTFNTPVTTGQLKLTFTNTEASNSYASFREIQLYGAAVSNLPPTAVAGPDQSIRAGDPVNLDGSTSFDDNTASASLIYSWSFSTLPGGSSAVLTGATTATPSFVADVEDTYVVQLIVTDEGGLSSVADEVTISSDNLAPNAVAEVDFSLAIIGSAVNFDGSSSSDPEMDALTYSWSITAAPAGSTAMLVDAGTANPSLTPDLEGVYEVTLDVADFLGFGTPVVVEVTATSASGFAEIVIVDSSDQATALTAGQVTTGGNQNAFGNFLAQAISLIQEGDTAGAINKLNKAIARTDGCALRGSPDGNGQGRDWITDCDAQLAIYDLLTQAVDALEN